MKKIFKRIYIVFAAILCMIAALLLFSIRWMFITWTNLSMDELIYHLTSPLQGTNEDMIKEYLLVCVLPSFIIFIFGVMILFLSRKRKWYRIVPAVIIAISLVASLSTLGYTWNKLGVGKYMDAQGTESTFIEDNYVSPNAVSLVFPEQKRNLIYIFLESMETTYADTKNGGAFEKNVIPELTLLAKQNEDFSGDEIALNGANTMPGTTWTMGAMFAHTSGLPLITSLNGNDMDTQDNFFEGSVTLGDILQEEGYSQTLLIGSNATFGGRKLYFTEHGSYDIIDYEYALKNKLIPKGYKVFWGYEDEKLFKIAKDKLIELSSQDNPFNLTMLTVDTHFEDGYICEQCRKDYGDNQYANVMSCASRQIKEFISWIEQQSFYDNTTIVLVGDHLTMDSDFCEDIDSEYVRKVYTSYLNPGCELQLNNHRDYSTFDNFPTTLAALGVEIEGERLGLGTNLFSNTQTLLERFGYEKFATELSKKSTFMEQLANVDPTKEEVLKREEKRKPHATMKISKSTSDEAILSVTVKKIENVTGNISQMRLALWTEDDQSDIQYIEMTQNKDGVYDTQVNINEIVEEKAECHLAPYAMLETGEEYELGEEQVSLN